MGSGTVRLRDVFDTRPTLAREGDREVAMDDHGVRRIPANWRWGYLGATFTAAGGNAIPPGGPDWLRLQPRAIPSAAAAAAALADRMTGMSV